MRGILFTFLGGILFSSIMILPGVSRDTMSPSAKLACYVFIWGFVAALSAMFYFFYTKAKLCFYERGLTEERFNFHIKPIALPYNNIINWRKYKDPKSGLITYYGNCREPYYNIRWSHKEFEDLVPKMTNFAENLQNNPDILQKF